MNGPDRCGFHEAVVGLESDVSETLLRLTHSPIADECQRCTVCRWARTFIERRLAEQAGRRFPADQNGDAALRQLQAALRELRTAVHGPR